MFVEPQLAVCRDRARARLAGRFVLLTLVLVAGLQGCTCRGGAARRGQADGMIPFYALDILPELRLSLDDRAMARLAKEPRKAVRGQLRYGGETYRDVAIRLKGHRSMRKLDDKPAFKLRFDKYDEDGRFLGQKNLNLNNMVEDATMLREVLGYRLYREAGVAAPLAGYALVFLNDELKGLYTIIEGMDDRFLERSFADPSGNLYEGEYGCDLYPDDVAGFEHETGPEGDRGDLAAFTTAASGPPERLFGAGSPLDMKSFLSFLAVSAFIGDFDGYRHSHNYRIYHEPATDHWYFVPWGIDRVFKKHNSIYESEGLLAKRCFAHAPCRLAYLAAMRRVMAQFAGLNLDQGVVVVNAFIDRAAQADTKKPYRAAETGRHRDQLLAYLHERPASVAREMTCLDEQGNELDRDHDGHGCMDCADDDPAIHPGVPEACNGIDDDCSGLADDVPGCPCPAHEIAGQMFEFCNLPMTFTEAAAFCAARGLELARIDSAEQSRAVYAQARRYSTMRWWIGLDDRTSEDDFVWQDGAPADAGFTLWAKGEPDNDACNQDCAAIKEDGGGRWHDTHCGQMSPFLCRKAAAPVPPARREPGL